MKHKNTELTICFYISDSIYELILERELNLELEPTTGNSNPKPFVCTQYS